MIWQSPRLPGWRKINFITVTLRPHHRNIAAGLYCLATSPGFLPTLCEKWSGFFYVHMVFLSYTRDRRLKVSSERLGNEDKAPCPMALLPGQGSNRGPPVWKSEALTTRPQLTQIASKHDCFHNRQILAMQLELSLQNPGQIQAKSRSQAKANCYFWIFNNRMILHLLHPHRNN